MTQVIDFSRSFATFRIDTLKRAPLTVSHKPPFTLNNARIQIDCCCHVTDQRSGRTQRLVLGASCKTERVGVARDIWTEPNADYIPVYGDERFLIIKTWDVAGKTVMLYPPSLGKQPERQSGRIADAYDSLRIDLVQTPAVLMRASGDIIAAVLANRPLVARSEIATERYTALLEYPVKTINANERDGVYQTDTGPILLPDLSKEPAELVESVELAFVAFNSSDWAELIVRTPTPVGGDISVHHYARPLRLDARNSLLALS